VGEYELPNGDATIILEIEDDGAIRLVEVDNSLKGAPVFVEIEPVDFPSIDRAISNISTVLEIS
jgi:hypothetical protein